MNTSDIVVQLDTAIARLLQVREILTGTETSAKRKPGRPAAASSPSKVTSFNPAEFAVTPPRRTISPEARERIATAQKKRWAKARRAEKKAARNAGAAAATKNAARKGTAKKAASAKKTIPSAPETTATSAT